MSTWGSGGSLASAPASRVVLSTRRARRVSLYFAARGWLLMPAPDRFTAASTPTRSAGFNSPFEGSQRTSPGPCGSPPPRAPPPRAGLAGPLRLAAHELHDLVAGFAQLRNQCCADESAGTADEHLHVRPSCAVLR